MVESFDKRGESCWRAGRIEGHLRVTRRERMGELRRELTSSVLNPEAPRGDEGEEEMEEEGGGEGEGRTRSSPPLLR